MTSQFEISCLLLCTRPHCLEHSCHVDAQSHLVALADSVTVPAPFRLQSLVVGNNTKKDVGDEPLSFTISNPKLAKPCASFTLSRRLESFNEKHLNMGAGNFERVSDTFFLEIYHFFLEILRTFTGIFLRFLRSEDSFSNGGTFLS